MLRARRAGLGRVAQRGLCRLPQLETVGPGCSSEEISDVSRATVFQSMMNFIDMPGRFLPVTSVFVRPAEGEAGEDGALWRSMTFASGSREGENIQEHIYANPAAGVIRFVELEPNGKEGELEVVHALLTRPLRIEYFQRRGATEERVDWSAPRADAVHAIETTIALARAKHIQLCDPNFVGVKA